MAPASQWSARPCRPGARDSRRCSPKSEGHSTRTRRKRSRNAARRGLTSPCSGGARRGASRMSFAYQTLTNPDRIRVTENGAWVATFTIGCYTVTLAGPARTFSEKFRSDGATRTVTGPPSTGVRGAPGPVDATIDERWLTRALAANRAGTPDALAFAMQYIKNAPPILLGDLQIAGDASYGPLLPNGKRDEGSDFNDYFGLRWL